MVRRVILTFSTAALLCCLFSLYSGYVSPLVDPHLQPRAKARLNSINANDGPVKNSNMAELHLPKAPWATKAEYQFEIGETLIYSQHLRREGDAGEVHFTKFAMIMFQAGGDPEAVPITIISEAARLKFASNINLDSAQPGRIIEGTLQGKTLIEGPNGLKLEGRDFIFSEKALLVWSDNPVKFEYGPHSGTGKGLDLKLIAGQNTRSRDLPGITGIRVIRLRKDVNMVLVPDSPDDDRSGKSSLSKPGDRVHIRCKDEFQYDLERDQMSFETNVHAVQMAQDDPQNTLDCDRLVLQFRRDDPAAKTVIQVSQPPAVAERQRVVPAGGRPASPSAAEPDRRFGLPERLIFERAEAEGRDNHPAVLISEERQVRANAQLMKYDAIRKTIELQEDVTIRRDDDTSELRCPHVALTQDESQEWKTAVCTGVGSLMSTREDGSKFEVHWKKFLKKRPDPTGSFDLVEVEGEAVACGDDMSIEAETIWAWVLPGPDEDATEKRDEGMRPPDLAPGSLQRLVAHGNVLMRSSSLSAETDRLNVDFHDVEMDPPVAPSPAGRQPANRSGGSADPPGRQARKQDAKQDSTEPMHVRANSLAVKVHRDINDPNRTEPDEIWALENVRLKQQHEGDELPLDLEGQKLHVKQTDKDQYKMHLLGLPAHIRDRGKHIKGKDVRMDTARNDAQIKGEGLLRIPVNTTLEGEELDEPQQLEVTWKERMTFDGNFADFYGDVHTVLEDNRIDCQSMRIELSEKVSFMDRQAASGGGDGAPKISRILCQDEVKIHRFAYEDDTLIAIQRMDVAQFGSDFTADQKSGKTFAQGPGRLQNWQRGDGKSAGFSPMTTAKANRPLLADASGWEYTNVKFSGPMKGNIAARFTTFKERVEVLHGPVAQSTDTIDPDELPRDSGWMVCDELQLTQVEKKDEPKSYYSRMLGTGNVRMKGQYLRAKSDEPDHNDEPEMHIFHARGDSISYDESNGQYVIKAVPPGEAEVVRMTKSGNSGGGARAKWIEFYPARNRLRMDRASGLDGVP